MYIWNDIIVYRSPVVPQVNYTLLGQICNLWRNYDDIQDSWNSAMNIVDWFFDHQDVLRPDRASGTTPTW